MRIDPEAWRIATSFMATVAISDILRRAPDMDAEAALIRSAVTRAGTLMAARPENAHLADPFRRAAEAILDHAISHAMNRDGEPTGP